MKRRGRSLRGAVQPGCEVHVDVEENDVALVCDGGITAWLDLSGNTLVEQPDGVGWLAVHRLDAAPVRMASGPRQCTAASLKRLQRRDLQPGNRTVVDGIVVGQRGSLRTPHDLSMPDEPEDCTEPPDGGDLALLHRSRRRLIGRWWTPTPARAVQLFVSRASCMAPYEPLTLAAHGSTR